MKNSFSSFSFWLLAAVFFLFVANGRNVVRGYETTPKQKQALIDLYDSTKGPEWFVNENWLTGDPCENSWFGVSCTGYYVDGNVTEFVEYLTLSENGLDGTLPNSLQDLSFLWELKLDENGLYGTIPPLSTQDFEYLFSIDLSENLLSGSIPSSLFTLESLLLLNLGNNSLTGTIPEFSSGSLNQLELSSNALEGTIPSFTNLSLTQLVLFSNQLNGTIPAELGEMDGLLWLDLSSNLLTGSIPPFTLTTLQRLDLNSNQLSGTIQNDFNKILVLDLNHNSLTGSLPELKSSSLIDELNLNSNNFNGTIPDYGSFFLNFKTLDLSENNLTGKLPATEIQTGILHVQSNRLTGKLPHWLCDLVEFDISDNKFDCHDGPKCCRKGYYGNYECGDCVRNALAWWFWLATAAFILVCTFIVYLAAAFRVKYWPFQKKPEYISISS